MNTIAKANSISQSALSGIQKASEAINQAAEKIAQGGDEINADNLVQIKQSQNSFKANAAVIKVDEDLKKTVLDLIA